MRPAESEPDLLAPPGERGVAAIAIDLQDAREITKVRVRAFCLAIWRIDIGNDRRIAAAPWSIIASIGPELSCLGRPAPGSRTGAVISSANNRSVRRSSSRIWSRKGRRYQAARPTQSARVDRSSRMPCRAYIWACR